MLIDAGDRTPGFTISAVRFIDRTRGWITGFYANLGRSLILRTDDAGASWRVEADIAGEELHAIFIQGHEHVWAVGARVREGPQAIYRLTLAAADEVKRARDRLERLHCVGVGPPWSVQGEQVVVNAEEQQPLWPGVVEAIPGLDVHGLASSIVTMRRDLHLAPLVVVPAPPSAASPHSAN